MIGVVQKDADVLWWSREPTIQGHVDAQGNPVKNSTRIRRWVRRETAIGPRHKGGLRNMEWKTHVTSFWAQWIIRYMKPGEAAWKQIMDYLILRDARGAVKFPEHRWILACSCGTCFS